MAPLSGSVTAFFLFEVGDLIDLAEVRRRITATAAAPLALKSPAPAYVQYQQAPIVIEGAALGVPEVEGFRARLKAFDYGVISVSLSRALPDTWPGLLADGLTVYDSPALAVAAEGLCRTLVTQLGPAVAAPRSAFLSEDYVVFSVVSGVPLADGDDAEGLLARHGAELAQLLRGERAPLSPQERDEVLRHRISYFSHDLVIRTWTGAFVYDTEAGAQAALEILEFANSQLLEFRYYDSLLDTKLAHIYAQLQVSGWRQSWFMRRYTRAAQEVHSLFIDVNELTDKTENALTIAGDVYAARLFALTAARLGLDQWKGNVREKLKTLDDIYRFAVEHTAMARGEFLELTVVLILVLELGFFFAGIMD